MELMYMKLLVNVLLVVNLNGIVTIDPNSETKIACYGDTIILKCQVGEKIKVNDASYQMLEKNTQMCRHVNRTSNSCHGKRLLDQVQDICGGKDECLLAQDIKDVTKECQSNMYLKVLFRCIVNDSNSVATHQSVVDSPANSSKDGLTKLTTTSLTTTRLATTVVTNVKSSTRELSIYFRLLFLFQEIHSIGGYVKANPRKAVLCIILSLALGISLLIMYMLIIACYHRFKRTRTDSSSDIARDEADGVKQILISPPKKTESVSTDTAHYETVLVTRQNGVPLHETTISSDSTLLARKNKSGNGHAEVISTIKRTHSIDEGTQTDNEDMDDSLVHAPRTLSIQEAQELGNLVDVMNYYNSRIDDDDAFYPQFTNNFKNKKDKHTKAYDKHTEAYDSNKAYDINNSHDNDKYNDKYYYANRGPSFEDEGRSSSNMSTSTQDRQPLISHNNSVPIPSSPYHLNKNRQLQELPKQKSLSRNPSELSYTTSASNVSDSSLGNYSPDAIFNGDNLRHNSIQRTPKPGVRGDGYDFIVNSSRVINR